MIEAEFGVFRCDDGNPRRLLNLGVDALGQETIGGDADARDDKGHAEQHAVIHRHTRQMETHVAAHPEHGDVQQHADRDSQTTGRKSPSALPSCENLRIHKYRPCLFFMRLSADRQ